MRAVEVRLSGDGLKLAGDAYGDPAAPPVLFFHGGGQSRRAWAGSARRVGAAGYYGVTLDLRGHGDSDWAADGDYLLDAFARDLEALIEHFDQPVTLVGASRGGQAALVAASRHSDRTALLMLADVAPLLNEEGVDQIRAFFRASAGGFTSLGEAADTLHDYLGQQRMADPSGLAKAMRTGADGRLYWHWDPRTAAPEFLNPPSEGHALYQAAGRVHCPVVLVKAEHSNILGVESVAAFRALAPQLIVVEAKGARHMFTGDRNDAFAELLLSHLARCDAAAA